VLALRRGGGRPLVDGALAFLVGASLAGAGVHFVMWPATRRPAGKWWGVPVLTEAEGLRGRQLPAYTAVLYAWVAAALVALLAGTPARSGRYVVLGLLTGPPFRASARHHFEWLHSEAQERPSWWNRAGRHGES
jgi:hypothetical protein